MKSIVATARDRVVSLPNRAALATLFCLLSIVSGCGTTASDATAHTATSPAGNSGTAEEFLIVDCLLPGQVRQLGGSFNYLTQRRPIKTSQSDCEIRGGEYVAYDRADYSTALRIWLPMAQTGDAAAQTYVGEIYEKGLGLSSDYGLAAHWYSEAAKQGYSRAQINLGNLYEKGLGVPQDKQMALNLYRSASGLGDDRLLYASTLSTSHVPRQEYETVQHELVAERQSSVQLRAKLDRVNSELARQTSTLSAAEQQLDAIQTKLDLAIAAQASAVPGTVSTGQQQAVAGQMTSYQRDLELQLAQLRQQNSELSSSQQALVQQLAGHQKDKQQYQQQIKQLEQQLSQANQQVSRSEQELAAANAALEQQLSQAEALSPEFQSLQRDLEFRNQAMSENRIRLAQLEAERKALTAQLTTTDAKMTEYRERIASMQRQMEEQRQRMVSAEQEVAALQTQLAGTSGKDESVTSTSLQELQRSLEVKNNNLQAQRRTYALLAEEKEILAEQVTASERRRLDYEAQVAGLQGQLTSTNKALDHSREQVAALSAQLAALQATESALTPKLANLQQEVAEKNQALTDERVKLAALESESRARQQQLSELMEELDSTTAQLQTAENNYSQEKERLNALLAERETELAEVQHQLLLSQASTHMERANSEQALARQAQAHEVALGAQQSEVQRLSEELEAQLELVNSQRQQIERLAQEAGSYQAELASAGNLTAGPSTAQYASVDNSGPAIEIIEPPVVLVRSQATVNVRTFKGEREVVGKVFAPAGLLSLSVNGESLKPTDNNLFRSSIPLAADPTPVEVVLVDNEGRRAAVSFSFVDQEQSRAGSAAQPIPAKARFSNVGKSSVQMGDYHALVIGNNDYRNYSTLVTAVNDARAIEEILRVKYQFKTKLLINADRYTILSALNQLRETLDENDNLLIYYAGHGKLDESQQLGYWLPVDADLDNNINWISNKNMTDILNVMKAKHILVVADSCYAGTLTQTPIARIQADVPEDIREEWIKVMNETRARITLTSGGVGPVLDGGGGEHSVFANAFLETLSDNEGVLEGYSLYSRVLEVMASQSSPLAEPQVPQYAPIHLAGHESGEFFFNPS